MWDETGSGEYLAACVGSCIPLSNCHVPAMSLVSIPYHPLIQNRPQFVCCSKSTLSYVLSFMESLQGLICCHLSLCHYYELAVETAAMLNSHVVLDDYIKNENALFREAVHVWHSENLAYLWQQQRRMPPLPEQGLSLCPGVLPCKSYVYRGYLNLIWGELEAIVDGFCKVHVL